MENIVFERIKKESTENDVVLYMKGSAAFPQCGFSSMAVQILSVMGVTFKDINVLEDREIWNGIEEFYEWPTVPQLIVKGEFTGGAQIMREMYEAGELQELLESKGIEHKKPDAA